ncbi:hypothetical protein [Riemerella columbina]|uniref:hypothetical protein n=1 Tax=Riemerella columbina TaxID=103810 RepID=UPI00266EB86D|nr:hypothetical protein [Riemerella columbina]WKS95299.1 hypothetical protein NYR17_00745 [Riemerella columbina]
MCRKVFIVNIFLIFFTLLSCKKNEENCYEKFQDLYLKNHSLWMTFDRIGVESNSDFSNEDYKKIKKQLNDSLQITIDCALKNYKENEVLYLYKMKQLFLTGRLDEAETFLNTIDRRIVKDDIYFQLQLFSLLCKELSTQKAPIDDYKKLLKTYSPDLNPAYKDRAFEAFLTYLIDNRTGEFKEKLEAKYPTSNPILTEYTRKNIIKDIMMRGDMLIFD